MSVAPSEFFSQRTPLGDTVFVVSFRYNARMDRWLIDLADANLNVLLKGVPILTGQAITSRFKGIIAGVPKGFWVALDLSGEGDDPQQNTLDEVPLLYMA